MNERPDLTISIARLVLSATPVVPLASPSTRMARWATASGGLAFLSVVILDVRVDAAAQIVNGWFVARAASTLAITLAAAIVAFLLSVPGLEPSPPVRTLPLAACLVWASLLISAITLTGSSIDHLQRPLRFSCALLIAAMALPSGVLLVRMLRQAAPLQLRWAGGFAGLASAASGALGAQFVCFDDGAAHHLLRHFTPVMLIMVASFAFGSSLLGGTDRLQPSRRR